MRKSPKKAKAKPPMPFTTVFPTVGSCILKLTDNTEYYFWPEMDTQKHETRMMIAKKIRYQKFHAWPRFSLGYFSAEGELVRTGGLPDGWNIELTHERKIQEVPPSGY